MQKPSISFHTVSGITKFHYVLYLIGSVTEVEPDYISLNKVLLHER